MESQFKRILNFATTDFYRNRGTSIAAIFVLVVVTLLVTTLFLLHGLTGFLVETVQNKIDITAYFKEGTQESDILNVQADISKEPNVKSVTYVSEDQALQNFQQQHAGNDVISQALTEVGENPFLPSLNVVTNGDPSQYAQIANILQSDQYSSLVDHVDYSQKKDTIQKVYQITSTANEFGIALGVLLILVAILVVFNTIKLVIDMSKEEINTMVIVGASKWFVRLPFIIEGAIFGLISFGICFLVIFLLSYVLSPGVAVILPGFSLFGFFLSNIWLIILIQLLTGVGLGVISSFIVVRKYLKV